ncbi:MAG: GNAT family N-acetyltransferase [Planctomycetota bacterium]
MEVEWITPETLLPARMLLGLADDPARADAAWIARDSQGRVAGAARLSRAWQRLPARGPNAAIHVARDARRHGLGRALVHAALSRARQLGAEAVHASTLVAPGTEASAFAAAMGFDDGPTTYRAVLDAQQVLEECASLLGRLESRAARSRTSEQWLEGIRIHSLGELPTEAHRAIAAKQAEVLGGDPGEVFRRMRQDHPERFDPGVSVVLTDGQQGLIGFGLANVAPIIRDRPDDGLLESVYIEPSHRRGPAVLLLKRAIAERYLALGARRFTILTSAEHRDTRRHAERLGPIEQDVLSRPILRLGRDSNAH